MRGKQWFRVYLGLASAALFVYATFGDREERMWRISAAILFAIWENTEARS